MGEVDRLVTQTALAIRDADELEVAASVLDATLRRAKAEVLELAARELCMYCNDPGNWAPMSNSGYHQCNTPGPNMTRCGATKIHALRRELDARAARIEEGTHDKA